MKSPIRFLSCLALIVGAFGAMLLLAPARPALASGPDDDAKLLAKLDDDWSAAAAKRDVDLVASFYADNANAYPPGEPIAVGKAAARKVWAAYFAEPSFRISWKTTRSEVASGGDLGYTAGTYEVTVNGPDAKPTREIGKYLCVWKKQKDGSWKAIQDMWNADAK